MQTYSFACGVTVTLARVSPMFVGRVMEAARQAHIQEHGEPERPTYTVETAGGTSETWPHNAESVREQPFADDPAVQEAWQTYQAAMTMQQMGTMRASLKAYCVKGVQEGPPDEWLEEQAYWGLDVPDDPRDRKWNWIQDIASGWDEILTLSTMIQCIPNPIEEAAQAARHSFQRALEGAERPDAGPDPGTADQS